MTENILFVCGSLNQTTMMHRISKQMPEYDAYFTPFYADGVLGAMTKARMLDWTILGGRHRRATEEYLERENLAIDYGGQQREYDLVVSGTDLIVQKNVRTKRFMLVQEGMTEPEDLLFFLVRYLKFPRFLANTAATGLSDAYDVFCVASPGYRDLFMRKGVNPDKIIVTGIPNFDNAHQFLHNNFPYHNYVLVATSSIRETMKLDFRLQFLENAKRIAAGRQILVKLHPNENIPRAVSEIKSIIPEALILTSGNTNHMIANCDVLITQYSTVVYTGIALGKEVHSYFDLGMLRTLMPIQNDGISANRIAEICRNLIQVPLAELRIPEIRRRRNRKWQLSADRH